MQLILSITAHLFQPYLAYMYATEKEYAAINRHNLQLRGIFYSGLQLMT